ncbi:hypothetical protein KAOT1_06817 [Kordia algicida OT-1]|uniref:Uncharacterized protein n=1 Tax=Kordia algicida OT-1 TaxID=391587 RepID=A9E5F6_9FLAO|nr:hypothetical protein KAOT1_06817 [Kordia algicida OT-1]
MLDKLKKFEIKNSSKIVGGIMPRKKAIE